MDTQNTPVDQSTIQRTRAIVSFVRQTLGIRNETDMADTVHAFLILYAMHTKLLGMSREDAIAWLGQQWDGMALTVEQELMMLPTTGVN